MQIKTTTTTILRVIYKARLNKVDNTGCEKCNKEQGNTHDSSLEEAAGGPAICWNREYNEGQFWRHYQIPFVASQLEVPRQFAGVMSNEHLEEKFRA